jgi:hypothetical protein
MAKEYSFHWAIFRHWGILDSDGVRLGRAVALVVHVHQLGLDEVDMLLGEEGWLGGHIPQSLVGWARVRNSRVPLRGRGTSWNCRWSQPLR